MSEVTRNEKGAWQGDDADASHAAAMMNMRESGQIVSTRYNQWGQHLPPSYSDWVTPDEKRRREALARECGNWQDEGAA